MTPAARAASAFCRLSLATRASWESLPTGTHARRALEGMEGIDPVGEVSRCAIVSGVARLEFVVCGEDRIKVAARAIWKTDSKLNADGRYFPKQISLRETAQRALILISVALYVARTISFRMKFWRRVGDSNPR